MDGCGALCHSKSKLGVILSELDQLKISDGHRSELGDCLVDISSINIDSLKCATENRYSNLYDNVVISLIKFAECTVNALRVFKVISPQYGLVCNAIVGVVEYVCLNNVDSSVLTKFSRIQETDFQARCLATCGRVSQCITYMQGLPKPEKLDRGQKHLHVQLMASDVSVQTGLEELLMLGVKIEDTLKSPNERSFTDLMENVQLYCCMATFRELFLLYRFAIQTTFDVDATAVTRVSDAQRSRDREVLKFLYRPTATTARYFCKYRPDDWRIVCSFMKRRGLHAEDLRDLSGGVFQIQSMYYEKRYLSARKRLLTSDIILNESNADEKCTLFQLQGGENNVFTIYPCGYDTPCHLRDSKLAQLEVSEGPPSDLGSWCIQKIYPDISEGAAFYVIRLAADDKKCLYASNLNGVVYAKSTSAICSKHFWRLKKAEHTYFKQVDRFGNGARLIEKKIGYTGINT